MSEWITVDAVQNFPEASRRLIDLDGTMVIVFNLQGQYYAIEDICTHDGGDLSGGRVEGDAIICPRHGARFCIKTGEALTPPAFEDISTFAVRVENGLVQVRDTRWD